MVLLSALVAFALTAVFVVGGVEKLRAQSSFGSTLAGLGVPDVLVPPLRVLVPVAELGTAVGLMLFPAMAWPSVAVAALGVAFAAAGALSLRAEQPVACSCLGAAADGLLGRKQIILLPLWLAAAAVLTVAPPQWSVSQGLNLLALAVVASSGLHAVKVVRAWRNDAAYRTAIEEAAESRADIVVGLHTIEGVR
ncbi:MauE/DoxX family redox-associated membrane protein [Micromonospora tulbaghiae]|uniref:MauE/DoxX family redox-associated membrane protein n=1 Tax=Micromonospora tulbaghiae TaxID=479978 RepID=UPI003436DB59